MKNLKTPIVMLGILLLGLSMMPASLFAAEIEDQSRDVTFAKYNVITVTTSQDVLDSTDGRCSLREAVISANTNPIGLIAAGECEQGSPTLTDQIVLEGGLTYQLSIMVLSNLEEDPTVGDLDIIDNEAVVDVAFTTVGDGLAVIRGLGLDEGILNNWGEFVKFRLFSIIDATVTFDHVELRNGSLFEMPGAGLANFEGDVTISNSRVINNRSTIAAGLYNQDGTLRLVNTEVTKNGTFYADNVSFDEGVLNGAGIFNSGFEAHLTLENSVVSWNYLRPDLFTTTYGGNGGAIYNSAGSTITFLPGADYTEIIHNSSVEGGAIYNFGGVVEGEMAHIFGNNASQNGGGISNWHDGSVDLEDGFIGFHSNGVGIFNVETVDLSDFTLSSNGVGINNSGTVNLDQVVIQHSEASGLESDGGFVTIDQSEFRWNEGHYGGALRLLNGTEASITRSTIHENEATVAGGIFLFNSDLTMGNSTLSNNETTLGVAGGILIQGNTKQAVEFFNVTAAGNSSAAGSASALYLMNQVTFPQSTNSIWSAPAGQTVCASNTGSKPLTSLGNNISSDSTCFENVEVNDRENVDPLLDVMTEVDGFMVQPLLSGSPAINAIKGSTCFDSPVDGIDQRGAPRDRLCDIGAYEVTP
ncbi:MAG: choice-of-anchor Q domain-containing protein [Chloroflexota bacterium]